MSKLLKDLMLDKSNRVSTEGGDLAHRSTNSLVLDLFATGGAIRHLTDDAITLKIANALSEDFNLAIRTILYISDVRGGQGERRFFKLAIKYLVENYDKTIVEPLLDNVAEFGRWDYLFDYIGHRKYNNYVLEMIRKEVSTGKMSLIYKWLPSLQTSSNELARTIAKYLELDNRGYRKMLSMARKEMKVVERLMTLNQWKDIDYSKVPSKASLIYRNAFKRHDEIRYEEFVSKAVKGEVKINAGTLYPHELINQIRTSSNKTVDALWNALPDFIKDEGKSVLPMIDTSGSMTWTPISSGSKIYPIDVAVGFGIYLAERLKGPFKDTMLAFSTNPTAHRITGNTLYEKYQNVLNTHGMGGSTNLVRAFDFILDLAVANKLNQTELPTSIVIFSDMQFNGNLTEKTTYEQIKDKFRRHGYELPHIVYWNVQHRNDNHPVTAGTIGTSLVSGFSPVTLKYVLNAELKTPYELMLEVINQERYNIYKV